MAQPEPLSVDDALERLVNQFSDSMAFFRELIQNALDAGSAEVEVWFEHEAKDGLMVIHVDDWGAGMNREIIDTRLTRLFSSSKDGDRTKIGKFGIGFVSVFAIEPQAVSIDTSRDGEHWRILFDERRRFTLIKREEPTEGTKISIYKAASAGEYRRFCERAAEVVRYWCRHVAGEIRVDGELITEPFDLDAPCKIAHAQDEDRVVVAHPLDGQAFSGFYNRGLTLVEGQLLPGVAFKASSTRLEHTLTRDDVIRDAGFEALIRRVNELVETRLRDALFDLLDDETRALPSPSAPEQPGLDEATRARLEYLWRAARHHVAAGHDLDHLQGHALARSPGGADLSLAQLRRPEQRRVILARAPSPLTALLEREGATVVWLPDGCEQGRALVEALAPATMGLELWCTALPPRDSDEAVRWQVLATQVARLLDDWGARLGGVRLGHLGYPGSSVAGRVAITQSEFGEATLVAEASELGTRLLSSRRVVVLNADHPTIRATANLAQTEPELGAYLAVKAFFLGDRLDAETDEKLVTLTHDRRLLRVGVAARGPSA